MYLVPHCTARQVCAKFFTIFHYYGVIQMYAIIDLHNSSQRTTMYTGPTTRISFRLSTRTAVVLDAAAAARQVTRTELISKYIEDGLTNEKTPAPRTKQDD